MLVPLVNLQTWIIRRWNARRVLTTLPTGIRAITTTTAVTTGNTTGFHATPDAAERSAPAVSPSILTLLVGRSTAPGSTKAVRKYQKTRWWTGTRALDQVESAAPQLLIAAIINRDGVLKSSKCSARYSGQPFMLRVAKSDCLNVVLWIRTASAIVSLVVQSAHYICNRPIYGLPIL